MQGVLHHQRSKAPVVASHALFAANGMEAFRKAFVLRVDGQDQRAATVPSSNHAIGGINDGARSLQTQSVQRRLQREHDHVGHQRADPSRGQLREVAVQGVGRRRVLLFGALMEPQRQSLHAGQDSVAQDGVQRSRENQSAEREQTAAVRSAHSQESSHPLTDAVQETGGRFIMNNLALNRRHTMTNVGKRWSKTSDFCSWINKNLDGLDEAGTVER